MRGGHRLFFALWPDDVVRDAIAGLAHAELDAVRGRRTRVEHLHMTLQFLGDVASPPDAVIDKAVAAAGSIGTRPGFELPLDRLGSFGGGRVVWLGTLAPPAELLQLHGQLGEALGAHGLSPKHPEPFAPHVTLMRDARSGIERVLPALRWRVREFVLVDSVLVDRVPSERMPSERMPSQRMPPEILPPDGMSPDGMSPHGMSPHGTMRGRAARDYRILGRWPLRAAGFSCGCRSPAAR